MIIKPHLSTLILFSVLGSCTTNSGDFAPSAERDLMLIENALSIDTDTMLTLENRLAEVKSRLYGSEGVGFTGTDIEGNMTYSVNDTIAHYIFPFVPNYHAFDSLILTDTESGRKFNLQADPEYGFFILHDFADSVGIKQFSGWFISSEAKVEHPVGVDIVIEQ